MQNLSSYHADDSHEDLSNSEMEEVTHVFYDADSNRLMSAQYVKHRHAYVVHLYSKKGNLKEVEELSFNTIFKRLVQTDWQFIGIL